MEHQLKVTGTLYLLAEFSVFVGRRSDNTTAQVGKHQRHMRSHDLRVAQVQQLSGNNDASTTTLGFDLQINLKGIRTVQHTSGTGAHRSNSLQSWLKETVKEDFDHTGCLAHPCPWRSGERRLGDSNGFVRWLVARFCRCYPPDAMPAGNRSHAALAA